MSDNQNQKPKTVHSIGDHLYGEAFNHVHAEGEEVDHDHDDFDVEEGSLEDNPVWQQDHVSLVSVGIDIGSSGTQLIFSRIKLRRLGDALSSAYVVVAQEALVSSAV